jgi:hypothetical protein
VGVPVFNMGYLGLSAAYNDAETLPTFLHTLSKLDPKLTRHIFVTNNCTDDTNRIIDSGGHERISYDLHPDFVMKMKDPYSALAVAWQRLLRRAREVLHGDQTLTHVVYLDTDVFVKDVNALTKASKWCKDILCGSYLRDFPDGRFLATTFQVNEEVARLLAMYKNRRGEYYHFGSIFYDIIRPYVSSAGFMMLSRDIVLDDRINFFPIYRIGTDGVVRSETSPEFGYQLKARTLGYETWLDGTIELSHYVSARHRAWRSDNKGGYVDFRYPSPTALIGIGSVSPILSERS